MRSIVIILAFGVATLFALPSGAFAADGRALYAANKCVACHGADGHGTKVKNSDLTKQSTKDKTDAALAKVITEGSKPMRAYPNFSKEELDALVKHVRSFK